MQPILVSRLYQTCNWNPTGEAHHSSLNSIHNVCVCVYIHIQTAIYVTDPLQLSACSLLSPPSHSPIVSLDMLTPGSDHIVVGSPLSVVYVCVCVCLERCSSMNAVVSAPLKDMQS